MIGFLRGEVLEKLPGSVLLFIPSVAQGNKSLNPGCGVGYWLSVPQSPEYQKIELGECLGLYTYTHVREELLELYGFSSLLGRELFLGLLSVGGIGPKTALAVLSRVSPTALLDALLREDYSLLKGVPGIGKKSADRLPAELGDWIRKKMKAGGLPREQHKQSVPSVAHSAVYQAVQDAREALLGLGYAPQEIEKLVKDYWSQQDHPSADRVWTAADLVRHWLSDLR